MPDDPRQPDGPQRGQAPEDTEVTCSGGLALPPIGAGDGSQWPVFADIVARESGWNVHATNPTSGAYGIPQALPPGKMASAGADYGDGQIPEETEVTCSGGVTIPPIGAGAGE